MNERDIKIDLLRVCKVAGSDSDFNAVAFHALCDKLKQLGVADEREECAKMCESHVRYPSRLHFAEAIRARGNT
jgi:hypothetical protein